MTATQVSKDQCIEVQTNPGYYLIRDAAYAWDRAVTAFGKQVLITGAWRSYETQERIFLERYDRGYLVGKTGYTDDARWWPARASWYTRKVGEAAAAVPGTSNHGGGVAVDVKTRREADDPPYAEAVIFASWTDTDRARFLRVAAEHGWADDEGRSVNELWHLTYYPARDKHRGEKPTTPVQESDMTPEESTRLKNVESGLAAAATELARIVKILTEPMEDGEMMAPPRTMWRRAVAMGRRIDGRLVAREAVPVEVDIDASAVAEELLALLPKATAEAVVDTMHARLAQ